MGLYTDYLFWYNKLKSNYEELMFREMSLLQLSGEQSGGFPPF